ncbi:MAG: DUF167 family protein [Micavibrio sp.]
MTETRITIKLTPKAARNAVQGWAELADGTRVLKASVTAVPENGKANKALINLLSKEWRLPKNAFSLIRGETDRLKVLKVSGEIPP